MKYFIKNIETGEKIEVLPRGDAGESGTQFGFVRAELAGTPEWETTQEVWLFENADNSGDFVNNDVEQLDVTGKWDIIKAEEVA